MEVVSIIVPFYNSEKYLYECINSIICQTYHHLQIILIDDGSTDGSYKIANSFKILDDRIILVKKKNGGISSARNEGLRIATGKYLAWIDSDDIVANNYVEELINAFDEKVDVVQCEFGYFKNSPFFSAGGLNSTTVDSNDVLKGYLQQEYIHFSLYLWGKLFRRELFNDIVFPEDQTNSEELVALSKVLIRSRKCVHLKGKLYAYRMSQKSLTRRTNWNSYIHSALLAENRRMAFWMEYGNEDYLNLEKIGATRTAIIMYCRGLLHRCDKKDLRELSSIPPKYKKEIENILCKKLRKRFKVFEISPKIYFLFLFIPYELKNYLRSIFLK